MYLRRNTPPSFWQDTPWGRRLVIVISVIFSCILLMVRIPGLELVGVTPNWLLIWLVTWSVKRNLWQSVTAAVSLGLLWDSLTGVFPSHLLGLLAVALLTTNVYRDEYVKEDAISIMLIVFGMVIINETVIALQYSLQTSIPQLDIWLNYQKNSLASAVVSSLWAPLVYFPLSPLLHPPSGGKHRLP